MPKLSIITVNLNNKAGLADTAKSVVAQTYTDYEWLVIDGGSTDGSVEVIKEYADKTDKLVYWCSEPDGGIYQGMNKGIEKAKGEYCWFLNSGDYAYKNTTLAEIFANKFDEDIVYGDIYIKSPQEIDIERLSMLVKTKKNGVYNPVNWMSECVIRHQASFIKRDLLIDLGLYKAKDYSIAADMEFFVRAIFKYSAKVKHIDIVFATYIIGGISSIIDDKTQNLMRFEYAKAILENLPTSYTKIFVKSYIYQRVSSLLPFSRIKYFFIRFKKFGFFKTADYYFSKFVKIKGELK
ncbi:MAG: glycosyltransferase [Chitinivibrionia bacterium]|nr:glycosyltransferase [Chitinivibrionia bacterium]